MVTEIVTGKRDGSPTGRGRPEYPTSELSWDIKGLRLDLEVLRTGEPELWKDDHRDLRWVRKLEWRGKGVNRHEISKGLHKPGTFKERVTPTHNLKGMSK